MDREIKKRLTWVNLFKEVGAQDLSAAVAASHGQHYENGLSALKPKELKRSLRITQINRIRFCYFFTGVLSSFIHS
jgi:hypothetical protein